MTDKKKNRIIKVDNLARVEGEGALHVRVVGDEVRDIKFRIFEPPRFFEAFLEGRDYSEVPDITARICGICPIAYMMGASHAMEDALGVQVTGQLRALRKFVYCGEWIESHVLHAAMLHAPDFLGVQDSLQIAKSNPEVVKAALRLKKLGNTILETAGGGRAIHPVNLKVGGFYKAPGKDVMQALVPELKWGMKAAEDLLKTFATFDFPDFEQDYHCVSLGGTDDYPILDGRIVSNRGIDIKIKDFRKHFREDHVAHSNALQGATVEGEPYLTGPIARYNNNFDKLSLRAKKAAKAAGLGSVVMNPYKSILVRLVESLWACEEALKIVQAYDVPDVSSVEVVPAKGTGYGCTEAPRGICYHSYSLNRFGKVTKATIVPPTAQNQKQIEDDLLKVVQANLDMSHDDLKWRCEQTIRNYDPCISCATHFLNLTIVRD